MRFVDEIGDGIIKPPVIELPPEKIIEVGDLVTYPCDKHSYSYGSVKVVMNNSLILTINYGSEEIDIEVMREGVVLQYKKDEVRNEC